MRDCILYGMALNIRFNRPINNSDIICPGGYEMVLGEKNVPFDFCESYGTIDETDKTIVRFSMYMPDLDSFPYMKNIVFDDMRKIEKIIECYVYTECGNMDPVEIEPVEILGIAFDVYKNDTEDIDTIIVSKDVLDQYNNTLKCDKTQCKKANNRKLFVVAEADNISNEICFSKPFLTKEEAIANLSAEYTACKDNVGINAIQESAKAEDSYTVYTTNGDYFYGQVEEIEIPA